METHDFIGKTLDVVIDRPLGTRHPKHNFTYKVNYGYVPGTMSADGEEVDVYLLGLDKPVKSGRGKCIAVIHRTDDDDDKLVVSALGQNFTDEEIEKLTEFQEKWFKHIISRK